MHPDIIPFVPKTEYSRRDFVMTALAGLRQRLFLSALKLLQPMSKV